ncbi:lysophospholipid acyltransferase family protein [Patescibacteria group bacterium]
MAYPISRFTLLPLLRFYTRSVSGLEYIPYKGPFILACHHTSPLDGAFIAAAVINKINRKIRFITRIAPWGWLWKKIVAEWWGGCIPFDSNNRQQCLNVANKYLHKGRIVGIFPGGILEESDMDNNRGKTGVARLALWSKVPVIPVGLYNHQSRRLKSIIVKHLTNPHYLRITIGEPMTFPEAYDKPITHELLRDLTSQIINRVLELSK